MNNVGQETSTHFHMKLFILIEAALSQRAVTPTSVVKDLAIIENF
jgi:hypothetical protein